jgi:hypothetical protein
MYLISVRCLHHWTLADMIAYQKYKETGFIGDFLGLSEIQITELASKKQLANILNYLSDLDIDLGVSLLKKDIGEYEYRRMIEACSAIDRYRETDFALMFATVLAIYLADVVDDNFVPNTEHYLNCRYKDYYKTGISIFEQLSDTMEWHNKELKDIRATEWTKIVSNEIEEDSKRFGIFNTLNVLTNNQSWLHAEIMKMPTANVLLQLQVLNSDANKQQIITARQNAKNKNK